MTLLLSARLALVAAVGPVLLGVVHGFDPESALADVRTRLGASGCFGGADLPCIPGADHIGLGYDAIRGESKGLMVMEATFDTKREYTNPYDDTLRYAVPDFIQVQNTPSRETGLIVSQAKSASEYGKSLRVDANVGGSYENAFSASAKVTYANSFLQKRQTYGEYAHAEQLVKLYQATANPPFALKLSSVFTQGIGYYLNKSAPTFDSDAFVSYFGTHYVAQATFGGKGSMDTAVSSDYTELNYDSSIAVQVQAQYKFLQAGGASNSSAHGGGGSNSSAHGAASDFLNNTFIHSKLEGGDLTGDITNWDTWIKTFWKDPVMVDFQLKPLTELVTDADAKAALSGAISKYFAANPYPKAPACDGFGEVFCDANPIKCCNLEARFCCRHTGRTTACCRNELPKCCPFVDAKGYTSCCAIGHICCPAWTGCCPPDYPHCVINKGQEMCSSRALAFSSSDLVSRTGSVIPTEAEADLPAFMRG